MKYLKNNKQLKLLFVSLLFSFTYSAPLNYYREISVSDFFEILSIYQDYIGQDNINKQYGSGLALVALGLTQTAPGASLTGLSYLGNGLLNQYKIIRSSREDRFENYKKEISTASSREQIETISKQALHDLIGEEKLASKIDGGSMGINGLLLLAIPDGRGLILGATMMFFGGYIAFVEKGPLEKMIKDYHILDNQKTTINVESLMNL